MPNGQQPPVYGAPPGAQMAGTPTPMPQQKKNDGLAIASMVCSLVGICVFGLILGIVGIILGAISIKKINERPNELKGKGMAIAGVIVGIFDVVVYAILFIFWWGTYAALLGA